jgi:hypothetical protein
MSTKTYIASRISAYPNNLRDIRAGDRVKTTGISYVSNKQPR